MAEGGVRQGAKVRLTPPFLAFRARCLLRVAVKTMAVRAPARVLVSRERRND